MSRGSNRWLVVAAAIAGASGVAIGALGAHGLPEFLLRQGADAELVAKRLAQFDTGARYHLVHAVALLAIGLFAANADDSAKMTLVRWSGILMIAGIVLFSGSLYLLVVTNTPILGAITPLGGISWIAAWVLIAFFRPARGS